LHTRATRAERRDYRIIARTHTSGVHRQACSCTPFTLLRWRAPIVREGCADHPLQVRPSPVFSIYFADLQDSRLLKQKQRIALPERPSRA
jgi:hypothetical protein